MLDVDIRTKRFRTGDGSCLVAIRGLQFSMENDEFVCLMGPSGCGKTTTLRIILGLDKSFDGDVTLDREAEDLIGVMFQEPRLLPWRTVEENVRLVLPESACSKDLSTLFGQLGIDAMANFYPGQLSLGLARRAAMARAFAIEPPLLVLDEPFVSLDEDTAGGLRRLLVAMRREYAAAVLMVTHSLREAVELADRVVLLTPRPASVRAVVPIHQKRGKRDPHFIDATVKRIAAAFPGLD